MVNKLTPKAFADHFGVSKDTLLYYDNIGLFKPAERTESGYRLYNRSQMNKFRALLVLRDSGMPLKEIATYFSSPSPDKLNSLVNERISSIQAEVEELEHTTKRLRQLLFVSEEIARALKQKTGTTFEAIPQFGIVFSQKNPWHGPTSPEQWDDLRADFVSHNCLEKAVRIGSIVALQDLLDGNYQHIDRVCAIDPNCSSASKSNYLETFPKTRVAAIHYHQGPFSTIGQTYSELLATVDREGYILAGNSLEEYISNDLTSASPSDYITKITVPVVSR